MTPGNGGTNVVVVVEVVVLVVVVVGTVVAVGSTGTVSAGIEVAVGGAVTAVKQSVPGRYSRHRGFPNSRREGSAHDIVNSDCKKFGNVDHGQIQIRMSDPHRCD